ncbi:hypothetical protein [Salibacterium aidingense]|uniref:hypothetical protein n=1 Tax=Salibacterium aidingense TaxID=384933 RepID=UPI003BD0D871
MKTIIFHVKRIETHWKTSQWRLSFYALITFIGGSIGGYLVTRSIYSVLGALTGALIIVIFNIFQVIFKKITSKD